MNWWKKLCQKVAGMKRGDQVYRTTVDAGKAVAPVAGPVVQAVLTQYGLPATPEAALSVLVARAASSSPLPPDQATRLAAYIRAHLPPAPGVPQ